MSEQRPEGRVLNTEPPVPVAVGQSDWRPQLAHYESVKVIQILESHTQYIMQNVSHDRCN
jgi:hypothetical protein